MSATIADSVYLCAALDYAKRGWLVIPTTKKTPRIGEWQRKATTNLTMVKSLFQFHAHDGCGVRFCKEGGIIDIECDDADAEATLLELFDGSIPQTPTFGSTRGKHRLFRWHDLIPRQDVSVFKLGKLEFRTGANGKGAQTVFPPSAKRVWIISPDECEPAEIPDGVIERIRLLAEKKPKANPARAANKSQQPVTGDRETRLKRATAYLAKKPPAVSGQGGHDATYSAACKLVAFGLSRDDVFDLLSDWNRTCDPPWTDAELWHKIDDAFKADVEPMEDRPRASSPRMNFDGEADENSDDDQDDRDSWTDISSDQGRTELANARRFVAAFGENVRYCHPWAKWLAWDGTRWKIDDDGAVTRMATTIADQVWHAAVGHRTDDTIDFAIATSKASGVSAMLRLAASMRPVRVDELDANPWLLNCPNGTVDLRTGKLRPHRKEDSLTKLCPTRFDPDAASYCWDRFLEGVFTSQPLIDFMQRLLGYAITGDVREQILTVFHGVGSNGKSTLLNAFQEAIGTDYSSPAPPSLLTEKRTETHPTELASLFGRRLVIAQETEHSARLAESTVKQLTGGDRVSARRMREDFWDFVPTHKLILVTNHKPRVKGTDHAIWRRLVLVPFTQRYWNPDKGETGDDGLRQDKSLPAKLKAEVEGILAWMVQGCLAWQRDGLAIPEIVRGATAEYRTENDTLGRFVAECCQVMPSVRVKFASLYESLKSWCDDCGDNLPPRRFVTQWLRDEGYLDRSNNGLWFVGIALKAETAT